MGLQIQLDRSEIHDYCERWKIAELSIFGSALREDFHYDSDIDVLASFREDADWSLFDWVHMIEELQPIFGRKVDLVAKEGLRNPFRRKEILNNREIIYKCCDIA